MEMVSKEEHRGLLLSLTAAFLLGVLFLVCSSCANPYRAAWVSTIAVTHARNAADDGIARVFRARMGVCAKEHGIQNRMFESCVVESPEYKVAEAWKIAALPTINSAIRVTRSTLIAVEKARIKNYKWTDALRPAVCAISRIVQEYRHLFPAEAKVALKYLGLISAVTCKGGS
jgi:hypothetical protein